MLVKLTRLRKRIPYRFWLLYDGVVLSFLAVAVFFDVVEYIVKRNEGRPT